MLNAAVDVADYIGFKFKCCCVLHCLQQW